ncbi:MAG: ABC transporter permease [Solirubrobacteraceae bacterium]
MEIFITNSLAQGFEMSFMALGVLLTFNMMGFPDITVQGTFPLGAAVAARLLSTGTTPVLAILAAAGAGLCAGFATGIIHTRLRVNEILAGILTSVALYSVMLVVMGVPNIALLDVRTLFTQVAGWVGGSATDPWWTILTVGVVAVGTAGALFWFLHTDLGFTVRATGSNETMIRSLGVNSANTKVLALGLSNLLVATAGAMVAQDQGFADVNMGIGALIAAVASIILGESVVGRSSVGRWIIAALVGSILYNGVLNAALRVGFSPNLFQLVTAMIIIIAVSIPLGQSTIREKWRRVREQREGRREERSAEAVRAESAVPAASVLGAGSERERGSDD